MFERKFEFIVHHPLEICKTRIQTLRIKDFNKPASLIRTNRLDDNTLEVSIVHYDLSLVATIEQQGNGDTKVKGRSPLNGIGRPLSSLIVVISFIFCRMYIELLPPDYPRISLWIIPIFVVAYFSIAKWRQHHFINRFKTTLTQQKKKNMEQSSV